MKIISSSIQGNATGAFFHSGYMSGSVYSEDIVFFVFLAIGVIFGGVIYYYLTAYRGENEK